MKRIAYTDTRAETLFEGIVLREALYIRTAIKNGVLDWRLVCAGVIQAKAVRDGVNMWQKRN